MSRTTDALDRADVGDDRAGLEMRADLPRDRAAGADRDADDDEIGALDRRRVGLDHLIGEAELGDAPARRGRARGRDDRAHDALRARRARDRGADQADADQRQAVEAAELLMARHALLPHELRQRRDHEPVRLLAADGHAQRIRQLVGLDPAQDEAALGEEGVGLLGGAALGAPGNGSARNWRCSASPRARACGFPRSARRATSHCARARSRHARCRRSPRCRPPSPAH